MKSRSAPLIRASLCMWALVLLGAALAMPSLAKEYLIGMQCDRQGPTATVGQVYCPGVHDYIKLFNSKNSIPGHTVRLMEIDTGYNVPRSVEAYERHKASGALSIMIWGTPATVALTEKLTEDRILGTSPGFGSAAAANGQRFPYLFPAAASSWSQAATGIQFIMERWTGSKPPKIAYIYYDNPAGREPLPILNDLRQQLGFALREFAVPPPAIEMRPQVLDIARKFRADWTMNHLFGRGPSVSLKEFTRVGFKRDQMLGFVWAGAESDIAPAGWESAQGYYTMQFAHVGTKHPLLDEIRAMHRKEGQEPPEAMQFSVYYNRGIANIALHAEAIRRAVAKHGPDINGVQVKDALESMDGFNLDNFIAPVHMSRQDHEGGGFVRIFQVSGESYRPVSGWIQGYREVVMKHVLAGS
jgi:branched-chain amino acid transport system substrate-binding protein